MKAPLMKSYRVNLPPPPVDPLNPTADEYKDASDWTTLTFKSGLSGKTYSKVQWDIFSNIYTGPGYQMEARMRLFNESIYWVDSLQTSSIPLIENWESNKDIESVYEIKIRRVSGAADPSVLTYYDAAGDRADRKVDAFTDNSSVCFYLTFYP